MLLVSLNIRPLVIGYIVSALGRLEFLLLLTLLAYIIM